MTMTAGPQEPKHGLVRQINMSGFTVNVIGTLVGAGVYVLLGEGAALAGGGLWLAFLLGAIVAATAALSYAELASMHPKAGAEHDFLRHAVGRGLIPFLVGWVLTLNGSASVATLAIGFGGYLDFLWPIDPLLSALLLVAVLTIGILLGLALDTRVNVVFTVIEVGGLIVIIGLGLLNWRGGQLFDWPQGAGGVLNATALLFFAYTGFEDASKMSEEVRRPSTTVPAGLLLGLGFTALLYAGLGLAAVQLATPEELASSDAPLSLAIGHLWGPVGGLFIAVIALCSIANTALFTLLAHSRLMFAMARDGSLPSALAAIFRRTAVPWVTTLIAGVLAAALLPLGQVEFVGSISSWSALVVYASVSTALIILRYRQPDVTRPFRVPFNIGRFPLLPALSVVVTLALSLRSSPLAIAVGVAIAVLGVLVYPLLRR